MTDDAATCKCPEALVSAMDGGGTLSRGGNQQAAIKQAILAQSHDPRAGA
jgi:hypothetical protein